MKQPLLVNWNGYLGGIPPELAKHMREYVAYGSRLRQEESHIQRTRCLLSALSVFFRSAHIICIQEITPKIWFAHVEFRMKEGIKPSSLNTTLRMVQSFLRYLKSNHIAICETMLAIRPLKVGEPLPRDLTVSQVKTLLQSIPISMDWVWILLMLHSGLRTYEIRVLRWKDIDLKTRTIRIRESKGLQSRVVFLSPQSIDALNYLSRNSDHVFTYQNQPLSRHYCQSCLTTIGKRCGFHVHPHQLRHTCATMLLDAGMSILGVQKILGHKYVETTLRYARIYDSTVVKDFQAAQNKRS